MLDIKQYTYQWQGIHPEGKRISGEIKAVTLKTAKMQLIKQGIIILKIKRKWFTFLKNFNKKISFQEIILFFQQFAHLITAGIPIIESINMLRCIQEKPALQALILSIQIDIQSGKTLTQSLRKYPRYFDAFICHLSEAGEQTGKLALMLQRISIVQEKRKYFKNKIIQALLYPSILFTIALLVSLMMLMVIVPRFATLFENMHGKLPLLTTWMIKSSAWLKINFLPCLFVTLFIFSLTYFFFKNFIYLQQQCDRLLFKIPFFGYFLQKVILSRFAYSLATTAQAGFPLDQGLKITRNVTGNHLYAQEISKLPLAIVQGQPLHKALQKSTLFPPLLVQMVKIGEETGNIDDMLLKVANLYESQVDHFVSTLSHILEPLIIAVLGVLIGGLVIALYLPIFKLGMIA